jgi:adenylosuccinate synthase
MLNGVTQVIITKMDILDEFESIEVATAYGYDGKISTELPFDIVDKVITPQYKHYEGWNQSLAGYSSFESMPEKATSYIHSLESHLGTKISMISTGPEREKLYKVR